MPVTVAPSETSTSAHSSRRARSADSRLGWWNMFAHGYPVGASPGGGYRDIRIFLSRLTNSYPLDAQLFARTSSATPTKFSSRSTS